MTKWMGWYWAILLATATLWPQQALLGQTKEDVFRSVSPKQVEDILKELNLNFTKNQPKQAPDDTDFDFESKTYKIRLTLSRGKQLWLSSYFPKTTLERLNQWNVNAKFSRALLDKVADREYSIIEWQLDVGGGVTTNMIRQFVRRFETEVVNFDQFLNKG